MVNKTMLPVPHERIENKSSSEKNKISQTEYTNRNRENVICGNALRWLSKLFFYIFLKTVELFSSPSKIFCK